MHIHINISIKIIPPKILIQPSGILSPDISDHICPSGSNLFIWIIFIYHIGFPSPMRTRVTVFCIRLFPSIAGSTAHIIDRNEMHVETLHSTVLCPRIETVETTFEESTTFVHKSCQGQYNSCSKRNGDFETLSWSYESYILVPTLRHYQCLQMQWAFWHLENLCLHKGMSSKA